MTTPAHTELDSNNPQGSQTPTAFAASALANIRALRDMAIAGRADGFVQTRTTGTGPGVDRPQFITWLNSTLNVGFRMNTTWGGTNSVQLSSIQWEWTNDGGASWTAMGSPQVNTYDGGNNITASTFSGGFVNILFEVWTKFLQAIVDFTAHVGGVGAAVHGLGSISTQSASAAALTGTSALDGTGGVGQTTPPPVDATRVRETFHDYGAIASGGTVTIEWDKYAHVALTPNATTTALMTFAFSGLPASGKTQSIMVEVINGQRSADGKFTYPANSKFVNSRLLDNAFQLAGRDFFVVTTRDGGTRLEWQYVGKGG